MPSMLTIEFENVQLTSNRKTAKSVGKVSMALQRTSPGSAIHNLSREAERCQMRSLAKGTEVSEVVSMPGMGSPAKQMTPWACASGPAGHIR